jgi:hypothetical protein
MLTGGNFGVEASIMGTGILAIATVIAFLYYHRQEELRRPPGSLAARQPAAPH